VNFLAHAVLAGANRSVVAGSVAGDFVKGVVRDGDFLPAFLLGVRLHRRIDAFSNAEPALKNSADRLPRELRRIAPPCIDMLADHLLTQAIETDPERYLGSLTLIDSTQPPLLRYEATLHELLAEHDQWLSPAARRFFAHARDSKLFSGYRSFERTSRGIAHVCERLKRPADAPAIIDAIVSNMPGLTADFTSYWPQLAGQAEDFLRTQRD